MGRGTRWAMIIGLAALAVFLLLAEPYNSLEDLSAKAVESGTAVHTQIQQRLDLVMLLVEAVEACPALGEIPLAPLIKAADQLRQRNVAAGMLDADQALSRALSDMMRLAKDAPGRKACGAFNRLAARLAESEARLNLAARRFQLSARRYNQAVELFPTRPLALLFGYDPVPLPKADYLPDQSKEQ